MVCMSRSPTSWLYGDGSCGNSDGGIMVVLTVLMMEVVATGVVMVPVETLG